MNQIDKICFRITKFLQSLLAFIPVVRIVI